jgi:hypothetical protein
MAQIDNAFDLPSHTFSTPNGLRGEDVFFPKMQCGSEDRGEFLLAPGTRLTSPEEQDLLAFLRL